MSKLDLAVHRSSKQSPSSIQTIPFEVSVKDTLDDYEGLVADIMGNYNSQKTSTNNLKLEMNGFRLEYDLNKKNVGDMVVGEVANAKANFNHLIHEARCELALTSKQLNEFSQETDELENLLHDIEMRVSRNERNVGVEVIHHQPSETEDEEGTFGF